MMQCNSQNCGFSIVEVLVAATILSLSTIAMVVMIRKGTDIQVSVRHRQAARLALAARLETNGLNTFNSLAAPSTADDSVSIDIRDTDTLKGNIRTDISNETISINGSNIPVKRVRLLISWQETGDEQDSLAMERLVTE